MNYKEVIETQINGNYSNFRTDIIQLADQDEMKEFLEYVWDYFSNEDLTNFLKHIIYILANK